MLNRTSKDSANTPSFAKKEYLCNILSAHPTTLFCASEKRSTNNKHGT